jgi:beta-glucosidase
LAAARVKGFQGESLLAEDTLLACPKHFAAYGAVQGGMEYNSVDIPETTLREVHLPPFKAGYDAGALSTMSSFNDIAGVPSTGNHYLLSDILRKEWGFKGLVISDYTSEEEMIAHGYAADGADAAKKAITAGCDIAMQSGLYYKHLPDLVRAGKVPLSVVNEAVRRVLRVKKALGLFDNPYRSLDLAREARDIGRADTVALAREAARKSCVLLKNDNDLLPLPKTGKTIALIGPFVSDRENCPGPWAVFPDVSACVTLEEGFVAALGGSERLKVVKGCDVETPIDGGIKAAVAAAMASDIVVLHVGEVAAMSGEAQSRVDISIPQAQLDLAAAIEATGKPVVVLLKHGRALALTGAVKRAPAIMATWFLGTQSGHAIADLVFGDFAPQGRLTVSFPQASGQEPYYYNHRNTGRPQISDDKNFKARYREVTNEALYAFGHGLSYAPVSYGATEVSSVTLAQKGRIVVKTSITNRGNRMVTEVVQLYVHDVVASLVRPVRELKGFKVVELAPNETQSVEFTISPDDLRFVNADLKWVAEAGKFRVWIAPSAVTGTPASFELLA